MQYDTGTDTALLFNDDTNAYILRRISSRTIATQLPDYFKQARFILHMKK